jgi:nicotinamidase-related amidase
MTPALIVIDIQNDYFPGGRMELVGSDEASAQAHKLLDHFRATARPTFHIQHISLSKTATFFLPDSEGAKIHSSIAPLTGETVIVKHFPNSFRETTLLNQLKALNIDNVIITGMMTHMCVDATSRAAGDFGFKVTVVADACATCALTYGDTTIPAEHVHKSFLAALKSYGQVLPAADVLAQSHS